MEMNLNIHVTTKDRYFASPLRTWPFVESSLQIKNQPSKQQIFSSDFFFFIKSISYGEKFLIGLF